jgi:hypothetical protein
MLSAAFINEYELRSFGSILQDEALPTLAPGGLFKKRISVSILDCSIREQQAIVVSIKIHLPYFPMVTKSERDTPIPPTTMSIKPNVLGM